MKSQPPDNVTCLRDLNAEAVIAFLTARRLAPVLLPDGADLPGSYWGAPEAGLIGNRLYIRPDTPVHSILHTACHWLCMDDARRVSVHTNAGGDDLEEVAVCYLQCLLADLLPGYSRERLFADMTAWGYSFRLGSPGRWFAEDSDDAQGWLLARGFLTAAEGGYRLGAVLGIATG
ncbi:MAG: hypothetical protein HYV18_01560 [Gammaproteobacteria bacterium]|nr:hypothetical protein [Gammaproteobacteria bacterium]